jgi:hypothetical protein
MRSPLRKISMARGVSHTSTSLRAKRYGTLWIMILELDMVVDADRRRRHSAKK